MTQPHLDQEMLKSILHYDRETGDFTWLRRDRSFFKTEQRWKAWNTRYAGKAAGYKWSPDGKTTYRVIRIFDWPFAAHRLAFLYENGKWPNDVVDHADRDGLNNSWGNLREATRSENAANTGAMRSNAIGVRGVSAVPKTNRYRANMRINGRQTSLGHFDTIEAASAAYRCVARILHGEFAK